MGGSEIGGSAIGGSTVEGTIAAGSEVGGSELEISSVGTTPVVDALFADSGAGDLGITVAGAAAGQNFGSKPGVWIP